MTTLAFNFSKSVDPFIIHSHIFHFLCFSVKDDDERNDFTSLCYFQSTSFVSVTWSGKRTTTIQQRIYKALWLKSWLLPFIAKLKLSFIESYIMGIQTFNEGDLDYSSITQGLVLIQCKSIIQIDFLHAHQPKVQVLMSHPLPSNVFGDNGSLRDHDVNMNTWPVSQK